MRWPCLENSSVGPGEYKRESYEDLGLDTLLPINNMSLLHTHTRKSTAFLTRSFYRTQRMQDFTCPKGGVEEEPELSTILLGSSQHVWSKVL